jgi:hypothetical protein
MKRTDYDASASEYYIGLQSLFLVLARLTNFKTFKRGKEHNAHFSSIKWWNNSGFQVLNQIYRANLSFSLKEHDSCLKRSGWSTKVNRDISNEFSW